MMNEWTTYCGGCGAPLAERLTRICHACGWVADGTTDPYRRPPVADVPVPNFPEIRRWAAEPGFPRTPEERALLEILEWLETVVPVPVATFEAMQAMMRGEPPS